jgi:hypothetical protein
MSVLLRLVGIGLAAGFFGALFGVGGGVIIVPLLIGVAAFLVRPAMARARRHRCDRGRGSPHGPHGDLEPLDALGSACLPLGALSELDPAA